MSVENAEGIQLGGQHPAASPKHNIGRTSQNSSPTAAKEKVKRSFRQQPRDTSVTAAASIDEKTKSRRRRRMLEYIELNGGATCCEIEQALGMLHQSASSFISRCPPRAT